ncbi:MAG: hypothetical protein PF961_23765 [Planctomycetota bacterium]|jgi:RHS repeat-associated protein|nr:hypothetical protein [Planctomycetota bacterium]
MSTMIRFLLTVLVFGVCSYVNAVETVIVKDEAEAAAQYEKIKNCKNYKFRFCWPKCTSCELGNGSTTWLQCPSPSTLAAPDWKKNWYCKEMGSDGNSWIDNMSMNHHHTASDYAPGKPSAGCAPCGASGGQSANIEAESYFGLARTHRFRDVTERSSLSPGVFYGFDISLDLAETFDFGDEGNRARVFSPDLQYPFYLYDGMYGDDRDGVYQDGIKEDEEADVVEKMRIYDLEGNPTESLPHTATAVVRLHHGHDLVFEVIDLNPVDYTTTWVTDAERGAVLELDGIGQYVAVEDSIDINLGTNAKRTVGVWFKANATGGTQVLYEEGGTSRGLNLYLKDGTVVVGAWNTDESSWAGTWLSTAAPGDGAWHHLAVVLDGSATITEGAMIGYLDGVAFATGAGSQLDRRADNICIGAVRSDTRINGTVITGHGIRPFGGRLDDLRIYNVALGETALADLVAGTEPADAPVAQWAFDDSASKVAADSSGNGHDGILLDQPRLTGRIIAAKDRSGFQTSYAYHAYSQAEILESPERQLQVATITDPHGRVISLSYGAAQVGGRWVLEQATLPNGSTISYGYADGKLSTISQPDGTVSSFTWGVNENAAVTTLTYDDAGADGTHRRKTAWLTNNFSQELHGSYHTVWNSSSLLIRAVINGADEVAYLNMWNPDTWQKWLVYEGAGRVKEVRCYKVTYMADGWTKGDFTTGNGYDAIVGNFEATHQEDVLGDWSNYSRSTPVKVTTPTGQEVTVKYDAQRFPTKQIWPDGTSEHTTYNSFKQITRYRDRANRVTLKTYDVDGNLLSKEMGLVYNGSADVPTNEYAQFINTYTGDGLLASSTDANGNTTDYLYNDANYLTQVIEPADLPGDLRAVTSYSYDAAGRQISSTDAVGRVASYGYDERDRHVLTVYADGSTEGKLYGEGVYANLVIRSFDRNGKATDNQYDAHGRRIASTVGAMEIAGNAPLELATVNGRLQVRPQGSAAVVPVADPTVAVVQTCSYLDGTNLRTTCLKAGERVDYGYDYRQRLVATTRYPRSGLALTSRKAYRDNLLFSTTDPYGRSTWFAYRSGDKELVRHVKATVPAFDPAAVSALTRDAGLNAAYLITDFTIDAVGQRTETIDPRGIIHRASFDSRGRVTKRVEAAARLEGGAVIAETDPRIAAITETDYDSQSNVIEIRHPRYFDPADAEGYQQARTAISYGGRNLLQSRTDAANTGLAATEMVSYNLDRSTAERIDFKGNATQTYWEACCKRVQAQVDPLGHGQGFGYDHYGNRTWSATISDLAALAAIGCCESERDAPDAQTLAETTTRYDARNRPIAQTRWLVPLGPVDPNAVPIAAPGASDGLTTTWVYDDNLTDGIGLDSTYASQLAALLSGRFGSEVDGSAVAVTNPAGEITLTVRDGLGRSVLSLEPDGDATRTDYDDLVPAQPGQPGALLATASVRDPAGLALTAIRYADGAGRVLRSTDAEGEHTTLSYDANGNRISYRDPNGVGQDCVFDARNRDIVCEDTQGDRQLKVYDAASQLVQSVDAVGAQALPGFAGERLSSATPGLDWCQFDVRGRKIACTDRLRDTGGAAVSTTAFSYDANSNLLSITDAEGGVTEYDYDLRNLLIAERFPGHDAASNYDQRLYGYDAARRLTSRDDQSRALTTYSYDMANRLAQRAYPDGLNDTFAYDAASRLTEAASARYAVTVQRSYHPDSSLDVETMLIDGESYAVSHSYDAANRDVVCLYPTGASVTSTYTQRSQLASRAYAGTQLAGYTYDAGMRETDRQLGNGLLTTRSYGRGDNLVTSIVTPGVIDFGYSYDANKRKTGETDGSVLAWDQTFGYDGEDRLVDWDRAGVPSLVAPIPSDRAWDLSLVGDWDTVSIDNVAEGRVHNGVHELLQRAPTGAPAVTLSYDAKGNLTSDGSQSYAWDYDNRLGTAGDLADNGSASYRYDALGRRVQKTVTTDTGTLTTTYVLSGAQVVSEYEDGVWARSFVYGSYVDEPLAMIAGGETYYYHQNHLYSVAALTKGDGSVVERYGYDAYGASVVTDASASNVLAGSAVGQPYRFTGRRFDGETGLSYFRARYMDHSMGRFVGRDPLGYVDGMSTYRAWFVPGAFDPSGMSSWLDCIATTTRLCQSGFEGSGVDPELVNQICNKKAEEQCGELRDFDFDDPPWWEDWDPESGGGDSPADEPDCPCGYDKVTWLVAPVPPGTPSSLCYKIATANLSKCAGYANRSCRNACEIVATKQADACGQIPGLSQLKGALTPEDIKRIEDLQSLLGGGAGYCCQKGSG